MTKLKILKYPHPFLKKNVESVKVKNINDDLRKIIKDMFEIMYINYGGGLAATQVGLNMRFFIMDSSESKNQKIVSINPEIIETKGNLIREEGCLSFPGISVKLKRAEWVKMKAVNEYGKEYTLSVDGYLARCIQHEYDHLNGITYFDHLSPLKRKIMEKKYKKLNKRN